MSIPDSPQTREEMYLNAIASSGAIPASPQTRLEMYLNAIATGDVSGIPDSPQTREEMYLDEIARNGGGGGGAKTLFSSGWIKSYGSFTECEGNSVEFKTGSSTAHNLLLAPPANVARDGKFPKNSVCKIAVNVNAINPRLNVRLYSTASGNTIASATELFEAQSGGRVFAQATGSDVLTITLGGAASESLIFEPVNADGTSDGNASATITITGMSFNDEIIFGTV